MGVDAHSSAVYGYVVVPPTQGGEVVGGVVPASGSGNDVVDFEAVWGGAAVDGAASVSCEDGSACGWFDRPGGSVVDDVLARDGDVLCPAAACDEVYGVGSYPASGEHRGSLLVAGVLSEGIVSDDHEQRFPPAARR